MAPNGRDPVKRVLNAARRGSSITLTRHEVKLLAAGLVSAAARLKRSEKPRWWKRGRT